MFKVRVLHHLDPLSDDGLEYPIRERLKALGLGVMVKCCVREV
jgi:hypothetical protein